MKLATFLTLLPLALPVFAQETKDPVVLVPWQPVTKEAPLFFSATAAVKLKPGLTEVTGTQDITFRIHQGKPETLTLALGGAGEVTSVTGEGIRDWSVRVAADGARFLDLRPVLPEAKNAPLPQEIKITLTTRMPLAAGATSVLLPRRGPATSLAIDLTIERDPTIETRVTAVEGLVPVAGRDAMGFVGTGDAKLDLQTQPGGLAVHGVELNGTRLDARLAADGGSVSLNLSAIARAEAEGSRITLCQGAALANGVAGDGWHLELRKLGDAQVYDLVAERPGEFPVAMELVAPVTRNGDWRSLTFRIAGGVVVPIKLSGLPKGAEFNRTMGVVPERAGQSNDWMGFLPSNGQAALAWRTADSVADGALFFSSTETTDLRVGSGLLRQLTVMDLRVLQGKLGGLSLDLTGPGEVLSVTGEGVLGWTVKDAAEKRVLEVKLNQPVTGTARLVVEAQSALGAFPVKADPLRLAPAGSLRHSGWLRVANDGAVRIEITDPKGLIQLAPAQFPAGVDESLRQVFVYRFPSAEYGYGIQADQVIPEVSVTEVTVYELAEADRRVRADLELDIREAPLREWEIDIPSDYAVAAVAGEPVADYQLIGGAKPKQQRLKIMFKQPVSGRQLVSVRLEQNLAAKAGAWELPPLGFPNAKSRRGYLGAVATAGFRLVPAKSAGLAEIPLSFFPRKTDALQQAFRLREETWQLGLTVEALGQSIQADVFHLYSLKSGAAYGSVLVNYFVVGAPATEWRIAVPKGIGNIDVTGQNVGRDWRREDDTVIVPLSRPLLGSGTVLLTFEQPMDPRAGELAPGEIRPLGVQGERGYVQIVSPMQVKFSVRETKGPLLEIDASELPTEFRVLSGAPTLKAWQYTGRDFSINTMAEWYEPGETAQQVVDFLKLTSRVSRDGEWSTDARMFVKSRIGNTLRIDLPAGTSLWAVRVNGSPANARQDGGHTLIPLPPGADSKQAAEVALRYGARSPKPTRVTLTAPKLGAPVVIGEWTVTGDEGRQLVPRGGTDDVIKPVLPETGMAWISRHAGAALLLAGLAAAAGLLGLLEGFRIPRILSLLCGVALIVTAAALAAKGLLSVRAASATLEYAAPVVAPNSEVSVTVDNLSPWFARATPAFWLMGAAGLGLMVYGLISHKPWHRTVGLVALGLSTLSLHGGVALFFALVVLTGSIWWLPRAWRFIASLRPRAAAPAAAALALALTGIQRTDATPEPPIAAESMKHDWNISQGRLRGTVEVVVRGNQGARFLLLTPPAVLSGFEGDGLRVIKSDASDAPSYLLVMEKDGRLSGKASFEMPLEDPAKGWVLPGGAAAMRHVTVRWDQPGWEFVSASAARVQPLADLPATHSGALLFLNTDEQATIKAQARQRDVSAEETRFFADVANLYLPGPGVVNGRHLVSVRPAQGRVSTLNLTVPEGFTVSDVTKGPVESWRFDPNKRELRVTVTPAQSAPFGLLVETQRGTGPLPFAVDLAPLRVTGSAGELGFLGVACADDAQVESMEGEGLSKVNVEDFAADLLPRDKEGRPTAIPSHAFRYGAEKASATLKVAALAPELRAETWEVVSLGDDRLLVTTDLAVSITRAGVFRLRVEIPDGLEIESATGDGLGHWTEGKSGNQRILTLHLREKTVGVANFNIVLSAQSPGAQASWPVPRVRLLDASREAGQLAVVPDRGLQVRAVHRQSVSQVDPGAMLDKAKGTAKAAARPGALAYRLLQADWALKLMIGKLDPWVTANVFHEATLREGQMLSRVVLGYKIENAAIKSLRVRIPGLDETSAATVRASGPAVADLVPVPGETGLWEIRFQRGIADDTRVELQYQRRTVDQGVEQLQPVSLENTRVGAYFAAIRSAGRLELEPGALPRGWQRTDWSVVQSTMSQLAGNTAPLMSFRLSDPEGPLPVTLKQLELAALLRLRVASGTLTTLLAPGGQMMTAVDLKMEVSAKGALVLDLPAKSELFNVLVNEEPANLVREGSGWKFHVFPSPQPGQPASVRFVYAAQSPSPLRLEGPRLNVPMENLVWRVLVPEGWHLSDHGGDFRLMQERAVKSFGLDDYVAFSANKRQADSARASSLLDQASSYLKQGKQELASQALGNALRSNQLDEATNEDARALEFKTKTDQTMLGLNTRRQRVQLDNRRNMTADSNERLDRATANNPLMRGEVEFDPRKLDQLLEGNTSEEISAMREIARRLVTQQLAAEAAPQALDITLPERGTVLTFGRSVQVDSNRMTLDLTLRRNNRTSTLLGFGLCAVLSIALTAGIRLRGKQVQA
ncbi:MAG: hypothetical protein J0M04_05055 [Verrucomicrobia bacterium]|nr:hypothetical protein [Verrucomicrobiota bacterium]